MFTVSFLFLLSGRAHGVCSSQRNVSRSDCEAPEMITEAVPFAAELLLLRP